MKPSQSAAKLTRFLVMEEQALVCSAELAQQIVHSPRGQANTAAKVLCAVSPNLTGRQCGVVIGHLLSGFARNKPNRIRNTLNVLVALPEDLHEKYRVDYFSCLELCLHEGNPRCRELAIGAFIERISGVSNSALGELIHYAAAKIFQRRTKEQERKQLLRLVYYAQSQMVKNSGRVSNRGLMLILKTLVGSNQALREIASRALSSLAPVLPKLLNQAVLDNLREILRRDVSGLGPKTKARALVCKTKVIEAIADGPGLRGMLAAEMLQAMIEDGSISHFGSSCLEREFRPLWSCIGMGLHSTPAFDEVWELLRQGFLNGGDIGPMTCAKIVASYGPQARCKLREMVGIFKEHHGDCGISSPLLWAILQVGIGTETPKQVLAWIRKQAHTCPHTAELDYLIMNRKAKPEPAFMRRFRKQQKR